ncbi:MAG: hypothetical protein UT41_C0001G0177 [Candidatus Wolfebacteria bacterium GW2011_GWC2_39_22]|uniref:Uncharacterized protein n=1 Tax=Candidatus Wolfebacteria bacterium GW2011_GWC2_39_22 TaxID=1619013 RepID=A0A0G0NB09_9BACT|nr:MAG: hypothetical protein UT41_C0001G0177 [Candidatus Wolfebacteria bacterium GW2011_GWC2_39_22]
MDRIIEKAHCACSTQSLSELCSDLLLAEELNDRTIRTMVVAELDLIISELISPSDQIAKEYLEKVRREIVDLTL